MPGKTLDFASGYNIAFGHIAPPEEDVITVVPRMFEGYEECPRQHPPVRPGGAQETVCPRPGHPIVRGPALSLSGAVTNSRRRGAVRLTPYPFDELADVRVGLEGFERVVFTFEFLVGDRGVYVAVARSAEADRLEERLAVGCPITTLATLVFDVFMARPGDEVMPGELLHPPATEPTGFTPHAAVRLAHTTTQECPWRR